MFVKSLKENTECIKPLLTGKVFYKNRQLYNYINTLIVLNDEGDILTSASVANLFFLCDEISEIFPPIINQLDSVNRKKLKKLENQHGIKNDTLIAIHNILVDIANNPGKLNIIKHDYLDMAIIKLEKPKEILVTTFPVFKNSKNEIGTSVVSFGHAFPEYETFYFDNEEKIIKTSNAVMNFPLFPLEGLITRYVADKNGSVTMFETSMPSIPGHSGAPVLNIDGEIIGMMVEFKSPPSNLNINLGLAIDGQSIIKFLDEHDIKYNKR